MQPLILLPLMGFISFLFALIVALRIPAEYTPVPKVLRGFGQWVISICTATASVVTFIIFINVRDFRWSLFVCGIGLMAALFGLIGYVARSNLRPKRMGLLLGHYIFVLICVSVTIGAAAASVAINGAQQTEPLKVYAEITVKGMTPRPTTKTVPFRASSGQVNFGCEQQISDVRAQVSLPAGARVIEARTEWLNDDNVGSKYVGAPRSEGDSLSAVGWIKGRDYQRVNLLLGSVANCPGGGHGELVLSGRYGVPDTEMLLKSVSIPTQVNLTDKPSANVVTLPILSEMSISIVFGDSKAPLDDLQIGAGSAEAVSKRGFFRGIVMGARLNLEIVSKGKLNDELQKHQQAIPSPRSAIVDTVYHASFLLPHPLRTLGPRHRSL